MTRPVAVLDADVLVPILSCDLLLSAFAATCTSPSSPPRFSARSNEPSTPTSGTSTRSRSVATPARSAPCSGCTSEPIPA
jgi:hypothetical protein